MDASAPAQFRAHARIGTWLQDVIAFEGEETLSRPFRFTFDTIVPYGTDIDRWLTVPATLSWHDSTSNQSGERCGIITGFDQLGPHGVGAWRVRFILEPRLALAGNEHVRIFRQLGVPELVSAVLSNYGYDKAHLRLLPGDDSARPYTLQAFETDFDFVQRLLARAGAFYWFENQNGREQLCIGDNNFQGEFLDGHVVYQSPSGGKLTGVLDDLRVHISLETPSACRDHRAPPLGEPPEVIETQQRLAEERMACERWRLHGGGNHAGLRAGGSIELDGRRPRQSDVSGIYLIVSARHRMQEATDKIPAAYRCSVELIKRTTPFRPPLPPKPELPELFSAKVESDGRYAALDGEGHYRVRLDADENEHSTTEASPPLPKIQPYGGPRNGKHPTGWHFPLRHGDEVLLTCLANDPDQPYLVGYAPSSEQVGPVTGENAYHNVLRTPVGNLFLFNDKKGQEQIVLNALDGSVALSFSAKAEGSLCEVVSRLGSLALQAKKNLKLQSTEAMTERVGSERLQLVANNSRTQTTEGDIQHQSAREADIRAGRYCLVQSNGKTQLVTGKHMKVNAQKGAKLTVLGKDGMVARLHDGKLTVQTSGAIRIQGKGGGDITFAQSGAGFTVGAKGDIKLFGKKVSLKSAGSVKFNGPVDYKDGGSEADEPEVRETTEVVAIETLVADDQPGILGLAWGRTLVSTGETVSLAFTVRHIGEGESATVTIYRADGESVGEEVDSLDVPIPRPNGVFHATWQPPTDPDLTDLKGPLAYCFSVSIGAIESEELSKPLYPTRTLETRVTQQGEPVGDGVLVALTLADGTVRHARTAGGIVRFDDVLLGPAKVRLIQGQHKVDAHD